MPPKLDLLFEGTPCLYCKEPLCLADALACHQKKIRPVLRGETRHGVCTLCLETAMLLERLLFGGIGITPAEAEKYLGRDIYLARIRCYFCGSLLDDNEKYRHLLDNEKYMLIRDKVRGRCYGCYSHGQRPNHV